MRKRPGGWRIVPEISVRCGGHNCPSHDLAGWRKERLPEHPAGIMTVLPDSVCEILSPGHERKDTITHFLRLQRAGVPHYWIIDPEDRILIAHGLDDGRYRALLTASGPEDPRGRVRVPPSMPGSRSSAARHTVEDIAQVQRHLLERRDARGTRAAQRGDDPVGAAVQPVRDELARLRPDQPVVGDPVALQQQR